MSKRLTTLAVTLALMPALASAATSTHEVLEVVAVDRGDQAEIEVQVIDLATSDRLPARAVVTSAGGKHVDGSGRGTYRDGRFFVEGRFRVATAPGKARIEIRCGPNYVPLTFEAELKAGRRHRFRARMHRWFSPEARGWYGGDNHVHAQHDAQAAVRTDLAYAALQGRANGLSFITEAGSNVSYDDVDRLDADNFLLRYAGEIRPGPYVGHFNVPGIRSKIPQAEYNRLTRRPLPAQALYQAIRSRGGVVIHTHPMTPRHQLHWMGATQAYSDAVTGRAADLLDVDAKHTQELWFAMLNLGNRIGVSSYTDAALGRTSTLSPGDRRMYCRAERLEYGQLVEAMRRGRTMATNGGPVFVFLDVAGKGPGETLRLGARDTPEARIEVRSLGPLRSIELYRDGKRAAAFDVKGKSGLLELSRAVAELKGERSWIVARAEDEAGKWCLTSPVYLEAPGEREADRASPAAALLLEVSNATRAIRLSKDFFAHLIVTVRPDEKLKRVELLRDGQVVKVFTPAAGNRAEAVRPPVTGIGTDYEAGWIWYPTPQNPHHFQADWPVQESGWYSVRVTTKGTVRVSDALHFFAGNRASHTLSVVNLSGPGTKLALWGYGEEEALDADAAAFSRAEWWYPQKTYWRLHTQFGGKVREHGWPRQQPVERFRSARD